MEEYYFLFGLGFIYTIFAVFQDLKTREIANWLNFSLVAFALAYRAFYSVIFSNFEFFSLGVLGFAFFFILGYVFYYGRVFAGGDAKLLMGFGVLLPYKSYYDILILGLFFIFILFLVGALWSLLYSIGVIRKDWNNFRKEFIKRRRLISTSLISSFIIFIIGVFISYFIMLISFFVLAFCFLYVYLKAVEKCMIKRKSWEELSEGDWLEDDVKVGRHIIKKSVHGLSRKEIEMIRKHKMKVYIKEGVPFTPAFLLVLIMVFFFLVLLDLDFLAFLL